MDTNVFVAAMRSPRGASAFLLGAARQRRITIVANVALALEYQAVCNWAEHILASGLSRTEVDIFVTAVIAMAEPVESYFQWRPQLRDPADEMVLEAAANGRAAAIVTFNRRDYGPAPLLLGVDILLPNEAVGRITP